MEGGGRGGRLEGSGTDIATTRLLTAFEKKAAPRNGATAPALSSICS